MTCTDVVIPGCKVEVLGNSVMIEGIEPSHHVRGDLLPGIGVGANGVNLIALVTAPCITDKLLPLQEQAGISGAHWNRNLRPILIGLAPVGRRPARVQVLKRLVFPAQPLLKLRLGLCVITLVAVLAWQRSWQPVRDILDWTS